MIAGHGGYASSFANTKSPTVNPTVAALVSAKCLNSCTVFSWILSEVSPVAWRRGLSARKIWRHSCRPISRCRRGSSTCRCMSSGNGPNREFICPHPDSDPSLCVLGGFGREDHGLNIHEAVAVANESEMDTEGPTNMSEVVA